MPEPIQTATAVAPWVERAIKWVRRPLVWIACKLAGIDAAREAMRIENQRMLRDHELKLCDELDAATMEVERLGPLVAAGRTTLKWDEWSASYKTAKHRLRDLHPDLPPLCDGTMREESEWRKIVQLARPVMAERRRKIYGG
jgi:hypothetical protein